MTDELKPMRDAKRLLQQHGAQEAWRILTAQALDEHLEGRIPDREATQKILSALNTLTARKTS